jgi:hypothetical protein
LEPLDRLCPQTSKGDGMMIIGSARNLLAIEQQLLKLDRMLEVVEEVWS